MAMGSPLKALMNLYPKWLLRREYGKQKFKRFNERPIEFAFLFRKLTELYPKTVIDVGTGTSALPTLIRKCGFVVTAVDNVRDYWPRGMFNKHYHVVDDDITKSRITERYDMVVCISVLEHIEDSDAAVSHMFKLLNPGGHLLMSFPYTERSYVRNVYELPGSSYGKGRPYITQSYSRENVDRWLAESNGMIQEQEFWQCWEGEHWTVGKQVIPPRRVSASDTHQLTCLHLSRQPSAISR